MRNSSTRWPSSVTKNVHSCTHVCHCSLNMEETCLSQTHAVSCSTLATPCLSQTRCVLLNTGYTLSVTNTRCVLLNTGYTLSVTNTRCVLLNTCLSQTHAVSCSTLATSRGPCLSVKNTSKWFLSVTRIVRSCTRCVSFNTGKISVPLSATRTGHSCTCCISRISRFS